MRHGRVSTIPRVALGPLLYLRINLPLLNRLLGLLRLLRLLRLLLLGREAFRVSLTLRVLRPNMRLLQSQ
jgi:hypothetical protein